MNADHRYCTTKLHHHINLNLSIRHQTSHSQVAQVTQSFHRQLQPSFHTRTATSVDRARHTRSSTNHTIPITLTLIRRIPPLSMVMTMATLTHKPTTHPTSALQAWRSMSRRGRRRARDRIRNGTPRKMLGSLSCGDPG